MAENRIKEIGVRKVLGASVTGITALLSKDFLKLVFLSFLIATPIAWWAMNTWLLTTLTMFPFNGGFCNHSFVSILIALISVAYQAVRAAVANPVKSLRTE